MGRCPPGRRCRTSTTTRQLTKRTLAWAPGAEPDPDEPGGGPDEIVTTFDRSVDLNEGTQSVTTTVAAGTSAAQPTTTTVDLVSGQAVSHTDAMGRTTTMAYDAIGRQTDMTTPGGMVTTTSYTPTQTTVTTPDGRVTRTTVDLLGRTVSITDNVRNGALVADPAARTVSSHVYSPDGTSVTSTDQAGRTTKAVLDAFGRTVSQAGPTGLVHLKSYDDGAAHTTVAALVPEGAAQPQMSTATSYDDANRAIESQHHRTRPRCPRRRPRQLEARSTGSGNRSPAPRTTSPSRPTAPVPAASPPARRLRRSPRRTFPGEPMSAVTTRALAGAATSRTLQQGDEVSTAVSVVYDAAGNVVSATDPEGRTTSYTYTPDGQPLTKTGPSGTVTTHTLRPDLGTALGRDGDRTREADADDHLHPGPGRSAGSRAGRDRLRRHRHDHLRLRRRRAPHLGDLPRRHLHLGRLQRQGPAGHHDRRHRRRHHLRLRPHRRHAQVGHPAAGHHGRWPRSPTRTTR